MLWDETRTVVDGLHERRIVDVTSGGVGELATEQLEVFRCRDDGQEVEHTPELRRRHHATVSG